VNSTIGIFDSGVGGLAVLAELERLAPGHPMIYLADQAWMPYGERTLDEVRVRSEAMTRLLLDRGADVIVVACNSASAAGLHQLRRTFPEVPFVGMEPAVKPAAEQTGKGIIGVLATDATFQGELYASVVDRHASGVSIVEQACPGLAMAVELGDTDASSTLLAEYLPPLIDGGVDTVVLGCTHYSFLVPQIKALIAPDVRVIDPAPAVACQTLRVLPGPPRSDGRTEYLTTGDPKAFAGRISSLRGISVNPTRVVVRDSVVDAVEALRSGRIIGVPTDTVYGVAVDPRNPDALAALADLKQRAPEQPFPVLVASINQALDLGSFNDSARRLAGDHWPGPLTLVVPSTGDAPDYEGTIGLRVPDHPATLRLLAATGPLAVTSANLSGEGEALDDGQAREIFGAKVAVYIEGHSPGGVASTVIDCTDASPVILRQGPVGRDPERV
jgi:glutamate racemase